MYRSLQITKNNKRKHLLLETTSFNNRTYGKEIG